MLAFGTEVNVINKFPQAASKGEVELAILWAKKVPSGLVLMSGPT